MTVNEAAHKAIDQQEVEPNRAGRRHGLRLVDRLAVSPREAAQLVGVSHPTMYVYLNEGLIASVKVGNRRLIAVSELRRFLAEDQAEEKPT
jgi:excisionase family DNA binding protein